MTTLPKYLKRSDAREPTTSPPITSTFSKAASDPPRPRLPGSEGQRRKSKNKQVLEPNGSSASYSHGAQSNSLDNVQQALQLLRDLDTFLGQGPHASGWANLVGKHT